MRMVRLNHPKSLNKNNKLLERSAIVASFLWLRCRFYNIEIESPDAQSGLFSVPIYLLMVCRARETDRYIYMPLPNGLFALNPYSQIGTSQQHQFSNEALSHSPRFFVRLQNRLWLACRHFLHRASLHWFGTIANSQHWVITLPVNIELFSCCVVEAVVSRIFKSLAILVIYHTYSSNYFFILYHNL